MGDLINTQGGDYATGNIDKRSGTFTNVSIHESPTPLALNLHQISPPPRDFTGRAAELTELLANFEKGVAISGLHGQGGIGKTALALKLAEQLRPRYPDAQFYLDLRGASDQKPLTVAEALAHVIRAYHPTSKLPEDEAQLHGLYQSVLHNQRALLLMDNAKDAAQVEPLLPPATCCLLVTSRQHFHLPGLHTKNLDALPPADARALLLTIAPRISPTPTPPPSLHPERSAALFRAQSKDTMGEGVGVADEIAKLCGYLPLALRLTASALAERADLSPADLIRKLTDTQQRLKLTGAEASLQLSYDLLTAELQKLWRALAVFPETFDRAATAAMWEMEEDPAHEALGELVKFSLLDYAPALTPTPIPPPSGKPPMGEGVLPSPVGELSDGGRGGDGGGRYRLHDLARLYADSRLPESERAEAQQNHAAYYETVLRTANKLYEQGRESIKHGLNLFDLEWKNIQAGQKWAKENAEKDEAARLCSDYPRAGFEILDLRHHPREQIRWLEAALVTARRLKQQDAEGIHLRNLGVAHYYLGKNHKAIQYHEQALVIDREIGDRLGESENLCGLGHAYYHLAKIHKAIQYYKQALVVDREIGNQRGEANALGGLGNAYAALGETRKAIDFCEQRLVITREIGDRRGEGIALVNLGNSCAALGATHKAIEFYERALIIVREIGDRRDEGNALFNMSLVLDKLGERAQAITHAEAALKIFEEIEHPYAERMRKQLEAWGLNH